MTGDESEADLEEEDFSDTVLGRSKPPAPAALDIGDTELRPRQPSRGSRVAEPVVPEAAVGRAYYRVGIGPEAVHPLDRTILIGRRPTNPRVVADAVPLLIEVPSARSEVSGTHLEIRQIGASVVVTDLRSTNGTVVMLPGSVPTKLRQGESVVVSPGTLVDIGDDNIIQILPIDIPASRAGRHP